MALVTKKNRVAEIGCEHAYTSLYLVEKENASKVIACDINKGPIQGAQANIRRYGYEHAIETRLSDGTKMIKPGEVDTILVSGMGGGLVVKILSDSKGVVDACTELILQPQSEIFLVRRYLHENGFEITHEDMVIDEGKYYIMMRAIHSNKEQRYESEVCYQYGAKLLESKNVTLLEYLQKEKATYENIYNRLQETKTEHSMKREQEVQMQLDYIQEGLQYYDM